MADDELPPITLPSTTAVANTATIFREAFSHPTRTTVLISEEEATPIKARTRSRPSKAEREAAPRSIVLEPGYKIALIVVRVITVGCFLLEQGLAWALPEQATHYQDQAFSAVDWGSGIIQQGTAE